MTCLAVLAGLAMMLAKVKEIQSADFGRAFGGGGALGAFAGYQLGERRRAAGEARREPHRPRKGKP